ncbi:translation initiation factor eIF-2B epsilon subunit, GEF [Elasticomyces elasticus]|nr:translation initiation factor eIF-2B epsilon subunit, GEF [Elasticomyces elasticus]
MAPKASKGGKAAKQNEGPTEADEPLQAVVFTDSHETRFIPFTYSQPRCLLKLANTPLIEYTLEWLASVGVQEVFVHTAGNHSEQVEAYLEQSKWQDTFDSLRTITSAATSVGDAMRDLDEKGLMKGDFISVYGDLVANIDISAALSSHKTRRLKNKDAIMTMILREAGDYHRTKDQHNRQCFVIDSDTSRCIHYEQVRPRKSPRLDIPAEVMKDHVDIDMREDLIDCGIDICTPDSLAQWSDSFDWKRPRKDFVHGVLQDYETFGRTIHTHIVKEGYAARVNSLRAYDAVSKDVVSRWTYPYSPDMNMLADQSYQLAKGNVYREDRVTLARSSSIGRRTVLGEGTSIGESSVVINSVIGRRCVVGKRVRIENAYIWDDAHIGDDTVVETAIVANEVSVGNKCHVKRGALVSQGVKVADGVVVEENMRLAKVKRDDDDEFVQGVTDPKVVGEGGEGFLIELNKEEEQVYEALLAGVQDMDLVEDDDNDSDFDSDDEDGAEFEHEMIPAARSGSFASVASNESEEGAELKRKKAEFVRTATDSVLDGMTKKQNEDNIQLELQSHRLAENAEDSWIREAVAAAFSRYIVALTENEEEPQKPKVAAEAAIMTNQRLITACVKEAGEQAEFLLFLQIDLLHRQQGGEVLLHAAYVLAIEDFVDSVGLQEWWDDSRSSRTQELQDLRDKAKGVVTSMVAAAAAESSEDEESGEDEDEDDEDDE